MAPQLKPHRSTNRTVVQSRYPGLGGLFLPWGSVITAPYRTYTSLKLPSIGEDCKTHFPVRLRFFDPGVCPRVGSVTSSEGRSLAYVPGRRYGCRESFGSCMHDRVIPCARRSRSGAVLHVNVRTILPSGPLRAIASFGSSEGHSLSIGSPGLGPWTRRNRDTHLRTDCAPTPCDDSLFVQIPNREVAYALRSASMARRCRSGSYASPSFHIRKPVAAMMRASVSLARLGFVPPASICS